MEYKFEKDYLYSIDYQGRLTLIPRTSIKNINTILLINLDRGIYRVEVRVYFHNSGDKDYITVFAKNFESIAKSKENLKIQNKYLLENY